MTGPLPMREAMQIWTWWVGVAICLAAVLLGEWRR